MNNKAYCCDSGKISTYASKISMGAVTESEEFIPLCVVCGDALGFVLRWHHYHGLSLSLSLCELHFLSEVILWWNGVIYFHGVSCFPLPVSSLPLHLVIAYTEYLSTVPRQIALNFFCSTEGQCKVSWLHWCWWRIACGSLHDCTIDTHLIVCDPWTSCEIWLWCVHCTPTEVSDRGGATVLDSFSFL